MSDMMIPEDVRVRLRTWKRLFNLFLWLHYAFGILGVLSSALAAALPKERSGLVTGFAVTSACCFAVIGFVAPEKRYLGFVRAWRTLSVASSKYEHGLLDMTALLAVMARCEIVASEPSMHDISLDKLQLPPN
jgi:hypothetical protein